MDINCEGMPYVGANVGPDIVSHPIVGRVNVSFIDGSVESHPNTEVKLLQPWGAVEKMVWWDQAHALR